MSQPCVTFCVRLSMAVDHLATTSASIDQIARLVGLDSEVSLANGFRRGFGISPGRYRSRTLSACPADPLIILV